MNRVKGRLKTWHRKLSHLSYRARSLAVNSLAALLPLLWPELTALYKPEEFGLLIQKALRD